MTKTDIKRHKKLQRDTLNIFKHTFSVEVRPRHLRLIHGEEALLSKPTTGLN